MKKINSNINNYTDNIYYIYRTILIISLPLTVISALVLSLPHSSATSSTSSGTDNVQLVLSTSCTVNTVVTSEHTVSLNGGQLDNNVGNTKLSAYCNDNNGYGIYTIGSSGDIDGNTDLINTVSERYNIRTGVYDSNGTVNPSSWAMKLTAGSGSGIDPVTGDSVPTTPPTIVNDYDNYSAIPSNYTLVAKRTSGTSMTTDTGVSGSYLNTTYQIYANSAQPSGTYTGKVKYVMVHPNNSSQTTIPDLEAAFAAAGKQRAYQDENGYYYAMQDMNPTICASVTRTGELTTTQLVDKRDNNLYYVTKEKDGNCWMTQNLDLKLDDADTQPLTSENTDISDNPTVYTATPYATGYTHSDGIYTWTPSNATADAVVDYAENTVTDYSHSYTEPVSAEGGDAYIYTNNITGNTLDYEYNSFQACTEANHTAVECRHYHVGNYYNWTAAIASNSSRNFNTQYDNAANSICPKGWRLPVATDANNESREFGNLLVSQGIMDNTATNSYATNGFVNIRKAPLWLVRSGFIGGNTLNNAASYGYYWSSTVEDSYYAYYLNFNSSMVAPAQSGHNRAYGRSVRCIAR